MIYDEKLLYVRKSPISDTKKPEAVTAVTASDFEVAEMRARRGKRVFSRGVYLCVNNPKKNAA